MFVDQVQVLVKAGDGGAGGASLRREPYKPRGGPDGGDGGKGGDVVVRVDPALFDLSRYVDRPRQRAKDGRPGSRNNRHGGNGPDLVIRVPDGTRVADERGLLADLVGPDAYVVAAKGGRGGRGTASLASARNRVPRVAERGEPGEERPLDLELRLVADVALVGPPNAGKSTLLSRLTAARPKVAEYPFTTLEPNLGVAGDERRFVVADVPGLVEGAHEGKGLGLQFLRHVSRCRALVYVVDLTGEPERDLAMVRAEVAAYDPELPRRRSIAVGTKADLLSEWPEQQPHGLDLVVSGATGEGVGALGLRIGAAVDQARAEDPPREGFVVVRPAREPFTVRREGQRFRVAGPRVERWVAETDLDDEGAVSALQRRLIRAGVERRLAEAGARQGDEILIGTASFDFVPDDRTPGAGIGDTRGRGDEA